MSKEFAGKVALVTGASRGIGKATALLLAAGGAKVVSVSRSDEGKQTVDEIIAAGGEAVFIRTDVSNEEEIKHAVAETIRIYGRLDCLYNNSAITGNNDPAENYGTDLFRKVLDTNLMSQLWAIQAALPHLEAGASIVNCSSLHGTRGMPFDSGYSSSKHAIIGLTRSIAGEVGRKGIRINAVCPGPIPTETMKRYESFLSSDIEALEAQIANGAALGRFGTPEEVANCVVFLLSDKASYVTGSTMMVDGGYSAI